MTSHRPLPEPASEQVAAWLRDELDRVPEPDRALQEALRSIGRMPQRQSRRRWFGWYKRHARPDGDAAGGRSQPERILWPDDATGRGHGRGALGAAAVARPVSFQVAMAAVLIAAGLALVAAATLSGAWPASPLGGLGASSSPLPRPSLVLSPPVDDGRDIIVSLEGAAHFRTLAEAVDAAVDGDRITLGPGEYRSSVTITKDISIRGEGAPEQVILVPDDGGGTVDAPQARYYPFSDELVQDWSFVLHINGSDARISNVTIRGAEIGTAVVIDGGAPVLESVVIDPIGEQRNKNASAPHEGLAIGNASTAMVRNSLITAFIGIGEGSLATLTGNTIRGSCLVISGDGTDPLIRQNRIEFSQCPRMSVVVFEGAAPILESNTILSDAQTDGIRVSGAGSAPQITRNVITGGEFGVWVGDGAQATIRRNLVTSATTGVEISGADAVLDTNEVHSNGVGIVLDKGAAPEFLGNTVCENEINLELRGGSTGLSGANDICDDHSATADVARPS